MGLTQSGHDAVGMTQSEHDTVRMTQSGHDAARVLPVAMRCCVRPTLLHVDLRDRSLPSGHTFSMRGKNDNSAKQTVTRPV